MKKIKVAILGGGVIASKYLDILVHCNGISLEGICGRTYSKAENLSNHNIHKEFYSIDNAEFNKIINYKELNKNIYCVGTTTLRAIETAYKTENLVGDTDLFILPDTKIKLPKYLITNFHAPMSSLLSIVQNAYGDNWKELYKYAIDQGLKFLSFGDAVLFKYK